MLTGANTEAIRKWGHDQVSTYGLGDEFGRDEWKVIGRELMRLGLAQLTSGRMSVVELTQAGRDWLRSREPIELTRPTVAKPKSSAARSRSERAGEIQCDEMLFQRLRELRMELAAKRGLPAYMIFGDVALREMARDCPTTLEAFSLTSGVGEKKQAEYGEQFISEIAAYLTEKE